MTPRTAAAGIWNAAKAIWFVPERQGLTKPQSWALTTYCIAVSIAGGLFALYKSSETTALILLLVMLFGVVPLVVIHVVNIIRNHGSPALFRRSRHKNGAATIYNAMVTIWSGALTALVLPALFDEVGYGLALLYAMLLSFAPIVAVGVARLTLPKLASGFPVLYRRVIDN